MVKRKYIRNLRTFIKFGKRYRVVYTTDTRQDAERKVFGIYGQRAEKYYDDKSGRWLVGVTGKRWS